MSHRNSQVPLHRLLLDVVAGIMAVSNHLGRPELAFLTFAASSLLAGLACLRLPEPGKHLLKASPVVLDPARPGEAVA
ncbi:hypothetical protein AB1L30_00990 [Bremerella sp. JC817]|uniref:hypothetical protein n=1 Tax=Bremerella sp. JC817 TaxID=3231756 RepID=UPI003459F2A0